MRKLLTKPKERRPEVEITGRIASAPTRKSVSFKEIRRACFWPLLSPLTFLREIFAGWGCLLREMRKIPSMKAPLSLRLLLGVLLLAVFALPVFSLHQAAESVNLLRHTVSNVARLFEGGQG